MDTAIEWVVWITFGIVMACTATQAALLTLQARNRAGRVIGERADRILDRATVIAPVAFLVVFAAHAATM